MPGTTHSGRRSKSATQHKLEGTFQKVRHAGVVTPEPPSGRPVSPGELAGVALAEWGRMLDRLEHMKALSVVDDAAIYQYCQLFAETEAIEQTQQETAASIDLLEENLHGLEKGELVSCFQEITKLRQLEARYTTQVRQGRMAIRQYLVEFGLTPSARTRVKLPEKTEADPFGEFETGQVQ